MLYSNKSIRPVDILTLSYLIFLFVITTIFIRQIPQAYIILSIYTFLTAALFLLIYFRRKYNRRFLKILDDLIFPVIVVFLIFDSLGGLVRYMNTATYDHLLIRLDYMIFRCYPTIALERITTPVITEVLQFAYISYYFMPIILGVALKLKNKEAEFNRSVFLIILCFFLSYVGYMLIPAVGPRYTMNHLQGIELEGIFLRDIIDRTLNTIEGIKRDAFPSGHSAIALLVLYLAYKFQKNLFLIFLSFVIALLFSTVYLRYHYAVDVFGGVLLVLFTIYIGEGYYNYWERRKYGKGWKS